MRNFLRRIGCAALKGLGRLAAAVGLIFLLLLMGVGCLLVGLVVLGMLIGTLVPEKTGEWDSLCEVVWTKSNATEETGKPREQQSVAKISCDITLDKKKWVFTEHYKKEPPQIGTRMTCRVEAYRRLMVTPGPLPNAYEHQLYIKKCESR